MRRIRLRIGDVFCVHLDAHTKGYFQYVAIDPYQLESPVIRAFTKRHPIDSEPSLDDVIKNAVEFFAHVELPWGVKMGLWERVGNNSEIGDLSVRFRDTPDIVGEPGKPPVRVAKNWRVWCVDKEPRYVRKLEGEDRDSELGLVMAPTDVVERMRTGEYDFVYPDFE